MADQVYMGFKKQIHPNVSIHNKSRADKEPLKLTIQAYTHLNKLFLSAIPSLDNK